MSSKIHDIKKIVFIIFLFLVACRDSSDQIKRTSDQVKEVAPISSVPDKIIKLAEASKVMTKKRCVFSDFHLNELEMIGALVGSDKPQAFILSPEGEVRAIRLNEPIGEGCYAVEKISGQFVKIHTPDAHGATIKLQEEL